MKRSIVEQWREVTELLVKLKIFTKKQPERELVALVERAKNEWKLAQRQLDFCDGDMLDSIIHDIQAKERRFVALLIQARQENVVAWQIDKLDDITS